jgi:hypothetical protein
MLASTNSCAFFNDIPSHRLQKKETIVVNKLNLSENKCRNKHDALGTTTTNAQRALRCAVGDADGSAHQRRAAAVAAAAVRVTAAPDDDRDEKQ